MLASFIGACLLAAAGYFATRAWRKRHRHSHGEQHAYG
jgi:hypothetical protein